MTGHMEIKESFHVLKLYTSYKGNLGVTQRSQGVLMLSFHSNMFCGSILPNLELPPDEMMSASGR